jgi:hypothetical protein
LESVIRALNTTQSLPVVTLANVERIRRSAAIGLSSVTRYPTMQRGELLSLYCPEAKRVQAAIGGRETDRFPNVELIETLEQPLYFDAREESGFYWASPVQTWLELMRGDKRDRETAEQVRESILRAVRGDR